MLHVHLMATSSTVGGLTTASELQLIFSDPDVLVATQPVLPWAKGHCRLEKSDGNTLRVSAHKICIRLLAILASRNSS